MATAPPEAPVTNARGLIERRTIGPVPADERDGSARGLFGLWLGINAIPLTVVTGGLGSTLFGLPFAWSILAIVVGNLVGGVFMALHASQGPSLGVPQMLQARGQFGARGASLVVLVATVMFVGFYVSNLVVGAQSLNAVFPVISTPVALLLSVAVSLAISVVGLRLIKSLIVIAAGVIGLLVVASFVWIAVQGVPSGALSSGSLSAAGFFSMVAVAAVWQIAYAPYVSDYSRYLPADTGARGAFWATYGGSVISACVVMALGALVGTLSSTQDAMGGLVESTGSLASVTLIAFALTSVLGNAGNVYCAALNSLTLVETFRRGWMPAARGRLTATAVIYAIGLAVAFGASATFVSSFTSFITILLYVLIPWSAINLVDYFLVQHGQYAVEEFFAVDGGRYGHWNTSALVVYAIGLAVQIPFAVLPQFVGPVAAAMHGVDIAWVLGLAVSGALYYVVARRSAVARAAVTPA